MPLEPDELRHAWLRALHRDDINELKVVYVCSKHFKVGDIECFHRLPNGDGTYREIPRSRPKLKEGAVPAILPGCPAYYSSHSATKRSRISREFKDDELLTQAVAPSLSSEVDENEKFKIQSFQDLKEKLSSLSIYTTWSLYYPNESTIIFMRPIFHDCEIQVDTYISVKFDLSMIAYHKGDIFPILKYLCMIFDSSNQFSMKFRYHHQHLHTLMIFH